MAGRRGRRQDERRTRATRRRQAPVQETSILSRVSGAWIVGGLIGLVILIASILFVSGQIVGQSRLNDFEIAQVFSLAVSPTDQDTMFLGDITGLFRSTDGGRSWDRHVIEETVKTVYNDPNAPNVYYATGTSVIWRSEDKGLTWQPVSTNLEGAIVGALASDPADSQIQYAYGNMLGLFRTDDGGATWSLRNRVSDAAITALAVKPGEPDTVYAFHTIDGFIISRDGGVNFDSRSVGIPANAVSDIFTFTEEPETVLAAAGSLIYKSTDSGRVWIESSEGLGILTMRAITRNHANGNLFASDFQGRVYVSTDDGENWEINAPLQ